MQHPYLVLEGEYVTLLSKLKITRGVETVDRAREIMPLKARYAAVSAKTGVPVVVLMALNERESSSSMLTYLGNGDRLTAKTRHVPAGRGPFTSWEAGAVDALHLDQLDDVKDWCWARACYEGELWNGFGYRARGLHTPYLWSGTNVYSSGKFVSDGIFEAGVKDSQLGTVPLMLALVDLDKSLDLPGWPAACPWPDMAAPQAPPAGHDGGGRGTLWLQESLNKLMNAGLLNDGSYGRRTAAAVRQFQEANGLTADGLSGPETISKLEAMLASRDPA
jgi:lysozyme family protein